MRYSASPDLNNFDGSGRSTKPAEFWAAEQAGTEMPMWAALCLYALEIVVSGYQKPQVRS